MATQNNNGNRTLVPGKPWLKPFQPGQSGNPGGRPSGKGLTALIAERTEDGATLVRFLVGVVEGREPRARVADRIEAARLLLDRAWGKAVASVELSGPSGAPLGGQPNGLAALSVEELRHMLAQREELLALLRQGKIPGELPAPGEMVEGEKTGLPPASP